MPEAAEISSNEKPSASLSTSTRAWAAGSSARPSRRSARSSESSASWSGVRPGATRTSSSSGSWRRAPRRAATSRQALRVRRWSQVENAASPRNWLSLTQSFARASWAASRASSGSERTCAARRATRGSWRAQSASRASGSPSLARFTRMGSLSRSYGSFGSGRNAAPIRRRERREGCTRRVYWPRAGSELGQGLRKTVLLPAGSRATTTSDLTVADAGEREVAGAGWPAGGGATPLTRTVTVAASETQSRTGRAASLTTGGWASSRNGSDTVAVPTASVASMTAA